MKVSWNQAWKLLATLYAQTDEKSRERSVFILWTDETVFYAGERGNHARITEALVKVLDKRKEDK